MSRLYIAVDTDTIHTVRTATASKFIRTRIFYNEQDRDKYITIVCNPNGMRGIECNILDANGNVIGKIHIRENDIADVEEVLR